MRSARTVLLSAVGVTGALCALSASAGAAPTAFGLVFHGVHASATIPTQTGLQHEGPFSGSAPFCTAGYAVDISQSGAGAVRRHTCSDGSGSFDAIVTPLPAEHGGSGTWRVVGGSGAWSRLRGRGTWTSVLVAGSLTEPASVAYRSTWQGLADLDDVAPTVSITRATARKLRRPAQTYAVVVRFRVRDDVPATRITFTATAQVGATSSQRAGGTAGAAATAVSFRLRVPRAAKAVRVQIRASDPVGNEREVGRSIRLRAR